MSSARNYQTLANNPDVEKGGAANKERRVFEWESLGAPWPLLLRMGLLVARQFGALAIVMFQIYYLNRGDQEWFMSCEETEIGMLSSVVCEYTKAYVRCFPPLAMVVSLAVACRLILHQRTYYTLLKNGVLVDFENFPAVDDPLFQMIVFCIVHAWFHFVFDIALHYDQSPTSDRLVTKAKQVMVGYTLPTMLFLYFLYESYDFESKLLSLSKYWEEDPRCARKALAKMDFVEEEDVAKAVMHGLDLKQPTSGGPISMQDACYEIIRACPRHAPSDASVVSVTAEEVKGVRDVYLSRWRLVSRMWTAELLLDPRLQDEDSIRFKTVWMLYKAVAFTLMLCVVFVFGHHIVKTFGELFATQYGSLGCLLVEVAHAAVTGIVSWNFLRHT